MKKLRDLSKELRDLSAYEGKVKLRLSIGSFSSHGPNGRLVVPLKTLARLRVLPVLVKGSRRWLVQLRDLVLAVVVDVEKVPLGPWTESTTPVLRPEALVLLNKHVNIQSEFVDIVTCDVTDLFGKTAEDLKHIYLRVSAQSKQDGSYIGDPEDAYRKITRYGITEFFKFGSDCNVASIGWSPSQQKWYGWSHRALYGFKIGDTVKEGDCCASSGYTDEYLADHPEENRALPVGFTAKSLDDCRRMAEAFAESVS